MPFRSDPANRAFEPHEVSNGEDDIPNNNTRVQENLVNRSGYRVHLADKVAPQICSSLGRVNRSLGRLGRIKAEVGN
ncbi:hypothetical protein PISMIDRAFT_689913 [Pisolithus microcarpus 441]|uniref:Uncharacterized protein n=1 Tax=Pisolithus microcarpus 441 TaxID=765257 RepID=A0A0C9Y4I4_9AGAM|nr:hypothetical protein PISMIDRAFT_689913 [Pisolithus microcarpus 441]